MLHKRLLGIDDLIPASAGRDLSFYLHVSNCLPSRKFREYEVSQVQLPRRVPTGPEAIFPLSTEEEALTRFTAHSSANIL